MSVLTDQVKNDISSFVCANWSDFLTDAVEYDGLQLTVACNDAGDAWNYQTGDNSYTGGAYGLPHWAVVGVCPDSKVNDILDDIYRQLSELICDIEVASFTSKMSMKFGSVEGAHVMRDVQAADVNAYDTLCMICAEMDVDIDSVSDSDFDSAGIALDDFIKSANEETGYTVSVWFD